MSDDPRHTLGRTGEDAAAAHLERRGFDVVERNHRTRWGELDLIAFDGVTLVFAEVKTRRAGPGRPFEAIHEAKQRQVRRVSAAWLASHPSHPRADHLRFDAIGVSVDPRGRVIALEHLEGAF